MRYVISACLLGHKCRYDGKDNYLPALTTFLRGKNYICVCPELMAGLGVPRIACEIKNNKIVNMENIDITSILESGCQLTLRKTLEFKAEIAILKARSPSCGYKKIYDGTFTKTIIDGNGWFTQKCLDAGLKVYDEETFKELI